MRVRLLAIPARITRELTGDRASDREVLRALWRVAGRPLATGTLVDLDSLPRCFGGSMALVPVLERLASEQFLVWERTGGGLVLEARDNAGVALPIDWPSLERRRRADFGRLDAMQHYSQTRACRRAFVLRYFGDPDARSPCDACDRCLSR